MKYYRRFRFPKRTFTLHCEPLTLEIYVFHDDTQTAMNRTNTRPLRSAEALSEPVDRMEISGRNSEGDSGEFGGFGIALFADAELTEFFDCDTCKIERIHDAKHT